GARLNGRLVPLKTPLQNGDIVEILTAPNAQPSRDWLSFVVTSRARNKLRQFIHTTEKEKSIEIGRRLLERELKKLRKSLSKLLDGKAFDPLLSELGVAKVEDLLADVGYGKLLPKVLVGKLFPREEPKDAAGAAGVVQRAVRRILPLGGASIR